MISRRALLALPFAAACRSRRAAGYHGYAFVANEEGQAVAAVDLEALAVAKHIALDSSPTQVIPVSRPFVYALTPENGSIQEIRVDRLSFSRKLTIGGRAIWMSLSTDDRVVYVLMREPRGLARVALDSFRVDWKLPLPETPVDFAISPDGKTGAVSFGTSVRMIDIASRSLSGPLPSASGEMGAVMFRFDGRALIAANLSERLLSLYDVASSRLIAHLPVAMRPEHFCFTQDGGQLFVTGEGMDAVVTVFPYRAEVFETLLAGHAPGAMATSQSYLFIASPQSGDVSILDIGTQKVIAVVSVGSDPGFVAVTPDDQYALVLNRKSGDVSVLRVGKIAPNRYKERAARLLTVIPVGSGPVSAAVHGV